MKKETKAAPDSGADALMRAFEEFKCANDERLAALEKKRGDALLEEKVDRIDRALAEQKSLIERAALNGRRAGLSADTAPVSEHKSAWSAYVRRGDETALASFEAKALSVGSNADGGYVAPPELDRLIESRLRGVSPMREIATVRTTGATVFKKPISITAAGTGWVSETAARTQTDTPTLALLEFPTAELYANLAATQTLLDDAFVNLEEWIAGEVEEAFGAQERAAFVTGDGSNKPKGFLGYSIVADGSHAWGDIGYIASGAAGAFDDADPVDKLVADADALLGLAEPSAPAIPAMAPTPAFSVLDLSLLPGAENDERPLIAEFASPWTGAHDLYAGADDALLSRRATVTQPAIMGELVWALWPGPVDRIDDGNVFRIKLYGGALASVTEAALLNGENAFALESEDGGWEILQAQNAVLVAPGEYELSLLLRGQQGTEQAMRAPAPVGARIIKLDARLGRVEIAAHEWGETLLFAAPPRGLAATDDCAATIAFALPHAGARPWAPAHLRAFREPGGDVSISWIRRAREAGDSWAAGDPPLGPEGESYLVEIVDGGDVVRSVTVESPSYSYPAADQIADFGAPPASLRVRVAQLGPSGAPGLKTDLTMPL